MENVGYDLLAYVKQSAPVLDSSVDVRPSDILELRQGRRAVWSDITPNT